MEVAVDEGMRELTLQVRELLPVCLELVATCATPTQCLALRDERRLPARCARR